MRGRSMSRLASEGWSDPVDIGGTGALNLNVNYPNVRRVTINIGSQCCSSCSDSNVKRTVTANLYGLNNTGYCYVGSVMYGHVASPTVLDGATYDLTSGSLRIGTVPNVQCGGCYTGAHSHMERSGGTVLAPCCSGSVSTSTRIYKFTWDNAQACS